MANYRSIKLNLALLFDIFIINSNNICLFVFTSLLTTLIIEFGLLASTEISGYNENSLKNPVNRETCICDCWVCEKI